MESTAPQTDSALPTEETLPSPEGSPGLQIPADLKLDLPFPMLIASNGHVLLAARLRPDNSGAILHLIEGRTGQVVFQGNLEFKAIPENVELDKWVAEALQNAAGNMIQAFTETNATRLVSPNGRLIVPS